MYIGHEGPRRNRTRTCDTDLAGSIAEHMAVNREMAAEDSKKLSNSTYIVPTRMSRPRVWGQGTWQLG
jgi:adenylate kinase